MALSVEKLLTDAHMLITRLKGHDCLADGIIGNSQALFNKVEAMKQYQDDITELNEIAKHRPRSTLVLGIAQENRQIRQLQQENRELEASLEEHQSALELIMQKYREHTVKLLQSNQIERALKEKESAEKNSMCHLMDKIDEMAGVMQKAIEVDETSGYVDKEKLHRMEVENNALREMLEICTTSHDRIVPLESLLKEEDISSKQDDTLEDKTEVPDEEDESDSDGDTSTLKRPDRLPNDKDEEDDSDDVDSSTLKRQDTALSSASASSSSSSLKDKEDSKKEEKKEPVTADSKKKTEPKKLDLPGKDGPSGSGNRSGSKSPVTSKSTGDLKKSRLSSSPVKRTTSVTTASAKKEPLKKTSSVDLKKDLKWKVTSKAATKK